MGENPKGEVEYDIAKRELFRKLSDKYVMGKYILNLVFNYFWVCQKTKKPELNTTVI